MLDQPDLAYPPLEYREGPRASLNEVLTMAMPVVIGLASTTVMGFVDTLMVARFGRKELAAVTPAALLAFTVSAFLDGVGTTNNTFVSQNFGARRLRECARYTWHAVYLALLMGLAVQVIQVWTPQIFALMGHEPEVRLREIAYFRIRLWGAGLFGMVVALANFNQGISRPRISMVAALVANSLNVALNYLLIFGRLGFPRMGIRGAALATVIASAFQAALLLAIFLSPAMARRFGTRRALRLQWSKFRDLLRIGGPVGLHFTADVASWAVFVNVLVGRFGETQLAASNAVGQFIHLSWLPTVGLNIAATQLMGQWIGRGRPDIARRRVMTALKIGVTYMAAMGVIFFVFRRSLVALFRNEPEVVYWGSAIMVWAALFQVSDAVGIVLYGALRGAGDTLLPALVVIGSAWLVFLPAGWLLAVEADLQAPGAWMGAAIHLTLIAVLLYWRFRSGRWRRMRLVEPAAPTAPLGERGPGPAPPRKSAGETQDTQRGDWFLRVRLSTQDRGEPQAVVGVLDVGRRLEGTGGEPALGGFAQVEETPGGGQVRALREPQFIEADEGGEGAEEVRRRCPGRGAPAALGSLHPEEELPRAGVHGCPQKRRQGHRRSRRVGASGA